MFATAASLPLEMKVLRVTCMKRVWGFKKFIN